MPKQHPPSGTHKISRPLIAAILSIGLLSIQPAHAQVPTTDGAHIGLQIEQWVRNYEQWTEQFNRWKAGTIEKFMESIGLKGEGYPANNQLAYQTYIDNFKNDKRCERMSGSGQEMARSICKARRTLEAQDLEAYVDVMNYTDAMQARIASAAREATDINAEIHPEEAKQKLAQVQAMQTEMSNTVKKKLDKIQLNEAQINILKKQQANLAQIALSGRVKSQAEAIADAATQAAILKAAFSIK